MRIKNYPYVSIVVCIYNGEKTLKSAINSLLNQDYPKDKYEVILVNDGSVDNSEQICKDFIEEFKNAKFKLTYVFQKNSGLSSARNTGVYLSKGDFIAFIDQDAVADEKWISEIVNSFGDDKSIGVVGGKIELLNKESWFATFIHWIHYYKEDKNRNEIIPIIGTNMAYRKEVFNKVGGFFEQFKSRGDEHSFIDFKVLTCFKQNIAWSAVAYHEYPRRLSQWFRERFFNGHEYALVHYISKNYKKDYLYFYAYLIFRLLCFSFPFWLIIGVFFHKSLILYMIVISFLCFIYRSFLRSSILRKFSILNREYGLFKSLCLFPLAMLFTGLGRIIDDYGFLRGLFKYFNTKTSDRISGDKILLTVTNI